MPSAPAHTVSHPGVPPLRVDVEAVRRRHFDDGSGVRAASGVAPLGDGWLVAQDDAPHAAWLREGRVERVRVVPSIPGHDVFSSDAGTTHLKPDLEAACPVEHDGQPGVLQLGSGCTPARCGPRVVPLDPVPLDPVPLDPEPVVVLAELGPLYARVAEGLQLPPEDLDLEGASRLGTTLRW